jgi:hypothetical protein
MQNTIFGKPLFEIKNLTCVNLQKENKNQNRKSVFETKSLKNYTMKLKSIVSGFTCFSLMLILMLTFQKIGSAATNQIGNKEIPEPTLRAMFDFMIGFEQELNKSNPRIANYFYDQTATTVNFFSDENAYLTVQQFTNYIDSIFRNAGVTSHGITTNFYNANVQGLKKQKAFNLLIIDVTTVVNVDSISIDTRYEFVDRYPKDTIIKQLRFTLLHSNYVNPRNHYDHIKIIDIEHIDDSFNPSNFYRPTIPSALTFRLSPGISKINASGSEVKEISSSAQVGFSTSATVDYRVLKGTNYNLFAFAGVGVSQFNSDHSIGYFEFEREDIDPDNTNFTRNTRLFDVKQDASFLYADFPIGLHYQHFINARNSIYASAGGNISWLLNSNVKQKTGVVQHFGKYTIEGIPFEMRYAPEFGFDTYLAMEGMDNPEIEELMFSWFGRIGYQHNIDKRFGFFFGLNYIQSFVNPTQKIEINEPITPSFGAVNPILNYAENIRLNRFGFEAGIRIYFKDLTKKINFGRIVKENRVSKLEIENYYAETMGVSDRLRYERSNSDGKASVKIRINALDSECMYKNTNIKRERIPLITRHFFEDDNTFSFLKPNRRKTSRISIVNNPQSDLHQQKGLYFKKPFGFNIHTDNRPNINNRNDIVFIEQSNLDSPVELNISPLPDFNLYIVNATDFTGRGFTNRSIVTNLLDELLDLGYKNDEECYVFFWMAQPKDSIGQECLYCDKNLFYQNMLEFTNLSNPSEPAPEWVYDLNSTLRDYLAPNQRKVNIHLIFSTSDFLEDLLKQDLPLLMNPYNKDLFRLNFYVDSNDSFLGETQEIMDLKNYFETGMKSVRLRNAKIRDIK